MADVLIRNLDDDTLRRIDEAAGRAGMSRNAYLRRELRRMSQAPNRDATRADFMRLADLTVDLDDPAVMEKAWS